MSQMKTIVEQMIRNVLSEEKEINESLYAKRSTEDLKSMYARDLAIINKMPKNAKYRQYEDVLDREFEIRKELNKRGEKVERPRHKVIFQ
jgi:hypothetical protein